MLSVAHHSGDPGTPMLATSRTSTARSALVAEQASGQQHLPRQAVAQHPQDLVPDIRLQPVQSQDHAALPGQNGAQPVIVGERGRNGLVVAVEQMGDRAFTSTTPRSRRARWISGTLWCSR